jgi:DNA polymerase-3 subunit chi
VQVDFYHLAATPPERVIATIAGRVVAGGGRLLIVDGDAGRADRLDAALWSTAPDSFLPHGRAGAGNETAQPILIDIAIGEGGAPINGARHIMLADGVWRDEALGFDRAFHLFDDATIQAARAAWKALATRDGIDRRFWKQDEGGRWTQAA